MHLFIFYHFFFNIYVQSYTHKYLYILYMYQQTIHINLCIYVWWWLAVLLSLVIASPIHNRPSSYIHPHIMCVATALGGRWQASMFTPIYTHTKCVWQLHWEKQVHHPSTPTQNVCGNCCIGNWIWSILTFSFQLNHQHGFTHLKPLYANIYYTAYVYFNST